MSAEMQTLPDGSEALVITTGTNIEVFALDVIASYSELLGEPDPAKTVVLIRGAMKTTDQSGLWAPLYEHLSESLGELTKEGVTPEQMPDAMEAATRGAAPTRLGARRVRAARLAARAALTRGSAVGTAEFTALLTGRADKLMEARAEFLKTITPPLPEPVTDTRSPFEEKEQLSVDRQ